MNQKSYFGYGIYKHMNEILKKHNPKKIFLVTGKESYSTSGAKELVGPIIDNYDFTRFNDFEINPRSEDIEKGVNLFKKGGFDFVIGIGGGSVIDIAKAISVLQSQKGNVEELIKDGRDLKSREVPLLTVPTTAGTGSESTHYVVAYINKIKYSLAHKSIFPDYAIIDPTFTRNLPSYITASSGMVAIEQGESRLYTLERDMQDALAAGEINSTYRVL